MGYLHEALLVQSTCCRSIFPCNCNYCGSETKCTFLLTRWSVGRAGL